MFTSCYYQQYYYSDRTEKLSTTLVLPDPQKGFHNLPISSELRKPSQHYPPAVQNIPEDTIIVRKTKVILYPSIALAKISTEYHSPIVEDTSDKSNESDKLKSSLMILIVEQKPNNLIASNQPNLEDIKILKVSNFT